MMVGHSLGNRTNFLAIGDQTLEIEKEGVIQIDGIESPVNVVVAIQAAVRLQDVENAEGIFNEMLTVDEARHLIVTFTLGLTYGETVIQTRDVALSWYPRVTATGNFLGNNKALGWGGLSDRTLLTESNGATGQAANMELAPAAAYNHQSLNPNVAPPVAAVYFEALRLLQQSSSRSVNSDQVRDDCEDDEN